MIRRIISSVLIVCIMITVYPSECKALSAQDEDSEVIVEDKKDDMSLDVISEISANNIRTVDDVLAQHKFTYQAGHGFAAEQGNNLIDRIKGNNARVIGDTNVKNGADRQIIGRDGTVINIQDKYYSTASQITCPDEEWVKNRLQNIDGIAGVQAVTKNNDPDGLLGKDGGYTSCLYFALSEVSGTDITGDEIVEQGTDGGGAIEIYDTEENALKRCDYLSQFDGTLLYSGSYTIVGTMVVRTSYVLSNRKQVRMTNKIIQALTAIEE